MTTTDRGARERRVHASVVIATTLVWSASAAVVFAEMRAAPPPAFEAPAFEAPASEAQALPRSPGREQQPTLSLADAGLRPAPPPRRRVVVVRRSRAS